MSPRQRKMHRIRRDLLKLFLVWPLPLAAARAQAAEEYVIVDGWVMKRTDLQPKNAP
jgi:hypothetical protein